MQKYNSLEELSLLKVFGGKVRDLMKSQKGAIAVEAAFVLPIVVIIVFILMYMALIQIQQTLMYMQAQKMAQKICNVTTFPGYENLYEDGCEKSIDCFELPKNYLPSSSLLDTVYETHNPYRYFGGACLNKYNNYENEIVNIIKKSAYFNGGTACANIDCNMSGLSTSVVVLLEYDYELPRFVSILGIDPTIKIKAQVITYANDTVEFIRNTDLTFDLLDFLLNKYQLKDKINVFYEKIQKNSGKLF